MEERFVASADAGVTGQQARFFYEPRVTGGRAFEDEGDVVEEVEGEVRGGRLFAGEALEDAEGAVVGGKNGESLKGVGRRLAVQDQGVGGEGGAAAHEGPPGVGLS